MPIQRRRSAGPRHVLDLRGLVHVPPPPGVLLVLFGGKHGLVARKVAKVTHQTLAVEERVQYPELPLETRAELFLRDQKATLLGGYIDLDPSTRHLGFAGEGDEGGQCRVLEIRLGLLPLQDQLRYVRRLACLKPRVLDLNRPPPLRVAAALHPFHLVMLDVGVSYGHKHTARDLLLAPRPRSVLLPRLLDVPQEENQTVRKKPVQHNEGKLAQARCRAAQNHAPLSQIHSRHQRRDNLVLLVLHAEEGDAHHANALDRDGKPDVVRGRVRGDEEPLPVCRAQDGKGKAV
mmetsp:Transcript_14642/g.28927  ORF Transcript_14642/g.28927 Transcript_14642/m.28927 type:complete len:290 (+) Transcript_14642:968-1837(+)